MSVNFLSFADVLRNNGKALAEKTAFVCGDSRRSFGEIDSRINRLCAGLVGLGLKIGDRVAILSRNRIEYFETYGAAKAGLIVVPLNWRLAREELRHPLADSAPSVVIAESTFAPSIDAIRDQLPSVRAFIAIDKPPPGWLSYEALLASAADRDPKLELAPEQVLCLIYTSGTTGVPKGVMLGSAGLMANCRAAAEDVLKLTVSDVALTAMPMFHVGGMWYHLFPAFASGNTTVICAEFSPEDILETLEREQVTHTHLVPTMLHALVHHPEVGRFALGSLRCIFYAASVIQVPLLRLAMVTFAHSDFIQSYGSTESGIVTVLRAEEHRRAAQNSAYEHLLGSCGRPVAGVEVRLQPFEGSSETGDIVVRGPQCMLGYWNNPIATAAVMKDGWMTMGDIGCFDPEGYLYIVDRRNDMIVTGGENVYPNEVEAQLCEDPAIAEVAVFALPDPKWVERVTAIVVLKPGFTATGADIIARARSKLADYKCPKEVIFAQELPRTATGKVLRKELRQRYGNRPATTGDQRAGAGATLASPRGLIPREGSLSQSSAAIYRRQICEDSDQ